MWRGFSNNGPRYDPDAYNEATYQQRPPPRWGPEPARFDSTPRQREWNTERGRWERERQDFTWQTETLQQMTEALRQSERNAEQALERERQRHAFELQAAECSNERLRAQMNTLLSSKDEEWYQLRQKLDQCHIAYQQEIEQIKANQETIQRENFDLHYDLQQMSLQSPIESEDVLAPDTHYTATSDEVWRSQFSLCLQGQCCSFVSLKKHQWQYCTNPSKDSYG
ncbi:hypothetical protein PFICI_03843 [Pestalotiopsis fici W106-1]|uniref:Uncharacterized protein n=1 Tax=Pestalotiopsis fici (strain W106-1 / CGMCC3.15140) TaxID=1229662 RepID=W3XIC6_PESFW|nr:uncharacterized protein PFICI_03843 [Pestalotiopsis fici W106-1]ETS85818.1 hypothetical protein PFICI_03843 [Pestalotiopsis fici W106-1]